MAQSSLQASIKERIREELLELGFHKVGFTDCLVLERAKGYLEERGAGPFEPEDLPPRTDPRLMMPTGKTVISVAMSYHHPDPERPSGPRGRLSKYCRGLDYHELMLERLEEMAERIEQEHGTKSVCFVDTGPPLERAFAEKAGLGRAGKNTNLIIPKLGSWVFLGMMVTELELVPDAPAEYDICGRCTLCIDACPTGCITEWQVDSENCLGYLNQKYDDVPVEHREAMGDWLFGCDICQEVCPHNIRAASELVEDFAPLTKPGAFPSLIEMVAMTEEQFETWFLPTAADWRGRDTIRRNAFVALGNCDDEEAVEVLLEYIDEGDEMLNEHARWAAHRLGERFPHRISELDRILSL